MFYILVCFGNLRPVSVAETEIVTAGLGSRLSVVGKYHNTPLILKSILFVTLILGITQL